MTHPASLPQGCRNVGHVSDPKRHCIAVNRLVWERQLFCICRYPLEHGMPCSGSSSSIRQAGPGGLQSINQFNFPALELGVFQEFLYGITPSLPILCLPIPVICEPEVAEILSHLPHQTSRSWWACQQQSSTDMCLTTWQGRHMEGAAVHIVHMEIVACKVQQHGQCTWDGQVKSALAFCQHGRVDVADQDRCLNGASTCQCSNLGRFTMPQSWMILFGTTGCPGL